MPDRSPSRSSHHPNLQLPHALTFRVMRLTASLPSRTNAPPLVPNFNHTGIPCAIVAPQWQAEGAPCGVGQLSVLPSSFGSIYASETFRSFISVFNRSTDSVYNVSVSIHMQTSLNRRVPLYDSTSTPRSSLHSRDSINNIVSMALPHLGVHVLVCAATYHESKPPSSSSPRTLRQFFRFTVLPPLDPTVSVFPVYRPFDICPPSSVVLTARKGRSSSIATHFMAHVRVHNSIPVPVYNANATFLPAAPFHVRSLFDGSSSTGTNDHEESYELALKGRQASMGSGDSKNFVFHVFSLVPCARSTRNMRKVSAASVLSQETPSKDAALPPNVEKEHDADEKKLGQVCLTWRSALGEMGRLERDVMYSQGVQDEPNIQLSIYAVPHQVRVHCPFVARCAARNNTGRLCRLYLQIRRDLVGEIVPMGVSGVLLGEVAPNETVHCAITLIGLVRGQHNVSGVRVVDVDSNISYKAEAPTISVT